MTLDEAITKALEDIKAVFTAINVANGNPIVMPDGSRALTVKPPDVGSVILKILNTQSILLQCVRVTSQQLAGGFVFSDAEANRIADLVVARIQALDTPAPQGPPLGT